MKRPTQTKSKIPVLLLYLLLFYGVWSLWEFWGKDAIDRAVENEFLAQWIKSGLIKNAVWTLPAIWLAHRFQDDVYIPLKTMFTSRVNILKYLLVFAGFTVYLLLGAWITNSRIAVSDGFRYRDLIIVLFVGITEEMVFRGWLLNFTVIENRTWGPVLLNAVLFLLIHFPIWIANGMFSDTFLSLNALCIPLLSIIFAWSFLKSKSLWIPIALHMYWDLLTFLFY